MKETNHLTLLCHQEHVYYYGDIGGIPMIGPFLRVNPSSGFEGENLSLAMLPMVLLGALQVLIHLQCPNILYDIAVMPMQYSTDTPLPLGIDAPPELGVLHHVQLVVMSLQYLVDAPLLLGGDVSLGPVGSYPIQPIVE
jgi:hypothetical protein